MATCKVIALGSFPITKFPTSPKGYRDQLQAYLKEELASGYQLTSFIKRVVGKINQTAVVFYPSTAIDVRVELAGELKILNIPANEQSLATSAQGVLEQLAGEGWLFAVNVPKSVGVQSYDFSIFYKLPPVAKKKTATT